jgi:hypothetical protein
MAMAILMNLNIVCGEGEEIKMADMTVNAISAFNLLCCRPATLTLSALSLVASLY